MAVVSRSWKNDADLEESVSMSLVAKLSHEAMLMAGGLSLAQWGGGRHLEEEEEEERGREGKEQIKHGKRT